MMFNRQLTAALIGAAALSGTAEAQSLRSVPVFVNGDSLRSRAIVAADSGRTLLPMRDLFESLGAQVVWDPAERAVYAWTADRKGIRIPVGGTFAQTLRMSRDPRPGRWGRVLNAEHMDAPAMMVGGRVFVPVRFASEALSAQVRYRADRPAVQITTQAVAGYREEEPPAVEEERPRRDRRDRGEDRELSPAEVAESLNVSLEIDRPRVDRDDTLLVRFIVRNTTEEAVVVPFRSGQKFDVEVLQEGQVVWNWASGRAFTQALTSMTLNPGQEQVYSVRWDLRGNDGRKVSPGRYMVRGILNTSFQRPQVMTEQTITVID